MSTGKSFSADSSLFAYAHETFRPEDEVLAEIRVRAEKAGIPAIHVGAFDGLHLEVLARMAGARKIVEIGTLAGYSGVCFARALPADGKLYTFEYEPMHAEVAGESFRRAGVAEKVSTFVGPALSNLPKIEGEGPFDLVFIDADKENYPHYLEWAHRNLRYRRGRARRQYVCLGPRAGNENHGSRRTESGRWDYPV